MEVILIGIVIVYFLFCSLVGGGLLLVGLDFSLCLVENLVKVCCGGNVEVVKVLIYIIMM